MSDLTPTPGARCLAFEPLDQLALEHLDAVGS
jgi:hypothetical protein